MPIVECFISLPLWHYCFFFSSSAVQNKLSQPARVFWVSIDRTSHEKIRASVTLFSVSSRNVKKRLTNIHRIFTGRHNETDRSNDLRSRESVLFRTCLCRMVKKNDARAGRERENR